eukprot:118821_1
MDSPTDSEKYEHFLQEEHATYALHTEEPRLNHCSWTNTTSTNNCNSKKRDRHTFESSFECTHANAEPPSKRSKVMNASNKHVLNAKSHSNRPVPMQNVITNHVYSPMNDAFYRVGTSTVTRTSGSPTNVAMPGSLRPIALKPIFTRDKQPKPKRLYEECKAVCKGPNHECEHHLDADNQHYQICRQCVSEEEREKVSKRRYRRPNIPKFIENHQVDVTRPRVKLPKHVLNGGGLLNQRNVGEAFSRITGAEHPWFRSVRLPHEAVYHDIDHADYERDREKYQAQMKGDYFVWKPVNQHPSQCSEGDSAQLLHGASGIDDDEAKQQRIMGKKGDVMTKNVDNIGLDDKG